MVPGYRGRRHEKIYRYRALNAAGEPVHGLRASSSRSALSAQLYAEGLVPVHIARRILLFPARQRLGLRSCLEAVEIWNALAGLPLPPQACIEYLSRHSREPATRRVLEGINGLLRQGISLAVAFRSRAEAFDPIMICFIEAGEETGRLNTVLPQLEAYLRVRTQARDTAIKALRYPVSVIAVLALVAFVLLQTPGMAAAEDSGIGPAWLSGAAALSGFIFFIGRRSGIYMRIPLIREYHYGIYFLCLGMLANCHIPLVQAARLALPLFPPSKIRESVHRWIGNLESGSAVTAAICPRHMPVLLQEALRIGMACGNLGATMERAAATLLEHNRKHRLRLLERIEPVLIIIAGLLLLLTAQHTLIPIYEQYLQTS